MLKTEKLLKKVKHLFEYILFLIFIKIVNKLGIDRSSAVFGKFARFIGPFLPHNKIAKKNLFNVFGNSVDIEKIIPQIWENSGRFIGEFPFIKVMTQEEVDKRTEILGTQHIQKLIAKNQPFVFFTGHFANWELALRVISKIYPKFAIVYRKSNNSYINKYIDKSRGISDYILIPKGIQGSKYLIKAIKSGYSIGMLVDQKLNEGIDVPFFNRPAKTATGAAELHLRYNYPLIPFQIIRTKGSNFKFIIHQALKIKLSGNKETDIYHILLKINQTIESWILEHKEQWLWFHNRWGKQ